MKVINFIANFASVVIIITRCNAVCFIFFCSLLPFVVNKDYHYETSYNSIFVQWRRLGGRGICPGRQQRVAPKRGDVIFATWNIQKLCVLCWGRDGLGRTNLVRKTMHILDVISSVSRSSKCTKIGGWGFRPRPHWGAYTALPNPLAEFKAVYF